MPTLNFPKLEQGVLKFWEKNKIFEKSLKRDKKLPPFTFYDGPPFASGLPHHGHVLISVIKDTMARYKTMRGYRVERRIGWDCHGLPVENLAEIELGIKNKRSIEHLGKDTFSSIRKFNQVCKNSVFRCLDKWKHVLLRIGRWADYGNQYTTMNNSYIESVWWIFKTLYDNDLIYKDYKVSPYCPRCGTCLSNFEVNMGYKEVEDQSIYVKFRLLNNDIIIKKLLGTETNKRIFFLAWTTTPWTLPGNVALAINSKLQYVIVEINFEYFVIARDRLSALDKLEHKIIVTCNGKELLGLTYEPLYNTASLQPTEQLNRKQSIYTILHGDFVTTDNGTGIVHIAPCFGEDDMQLAKQYQLPILITADLEGRIIKNYNLPGEGELVKDADFLVKADLLNRNILWKEEKIVHTYPFCWRCDHYLIYYSLEAWYVAVTKINKDLVKKNQKINWLPDHIKNGRFGKWIASARDWNISRSRFWGAPIPVWICKKCQTKKVIGSIAELATLLPSGNKFFVARHGEADHNAVKVDGKMTSILNSNPRSSVHLTKCGQRQVEQLAKEIKDKRIDVIIASQFPRTKETAEILNKHYKLKVIIDARFNEINHGILEGKAHSFRSELKRNTKNKYLFRVKNGESYRDVEKRVGPAFADLNKKYKDKNILIVTHYATIRAIYKYFEIKTEHEAAISQIPLASLHIFSKELKDLHRPFVDKIALLCSCGGTMQRVEDVFDCWFESGAMPYASWRYPFENRKLVESTYPADFVIEAIDQTRGWFYTLHVLATALTAQKTKLVNAHLNSSGSAFKNVIVSGLILDKDGKKLSKKLSNYTDPTELMEKYGADSLRYFLLTASPIGEDYRFADKEVEESLKKVIMIVWNVFTFYEMHSGKKFIPANQTTINPKHVLDKWIIAKLHLLIKNLTQNMDKYEVINGTRLIGEFANELSTWYLRRSRERVRENSEILGHVLLQISLLIAPSMPFLAEILYKKLSKSCESVHLENWPDYNTKLINLKLLKDMQLVREAVTAGHECRNKSAIKIRQPLQSFQLAKHELKGKTNLLKIIKEELNIKEITFGHEYSLDLNITPALKEEGIFRETVRQINNYRKEKCLTIKNKISFDYHTDNEELASMLNKFSNDLANTTMCKRIIKNANIENYDTITIDNFVLKIKIV